MPPLNIRVDAVLPKIKAAGKKQVFETLAATEMAGKSFCPPRLLYSHLTEQERIGASAIGDGIAIPHLQLPDIAARFIVLASLEEPVDFDAPDGKPVDLVCMLLSPKSDGPIHLRGLSRISRILKDDALCMKLRAAGNADEMHAVLMNPDGWLLAA
jgi:PTS system nitrogen regulatory IIA component